MRLALFIDGAFRSDVTGRVNSGSELFGFMRFACAVGAHFDRFVLLARRTDSVEEASEPLPAGLHLVPLPDYGSLRDLARLLVAIPRTIASMWQALEAIDIVWVTGVHPLGLLLTLIARLRRRRVVVLIRQDSRRYFRARLPSRAWVLALPALDALDWLFRALGSRTRTTVVGGSLARRYGAPRANVLEMRVNLLERSQLAPGPSPADWDERVALLAVGRLAPEKNPLLLVDALARLERDTPGRYSLICVGEGPLETAVGRHADALGIASSIEIRGFVPFGAELMELYRHANAFVHVALTEGVPGVLYEAMGAGLPIVATDVGGVRAALRDGEAGLLVPAGDAAALAAAVRRLDEDAGLRRRLESTGLAIAAMSTIESESRRVADFIAADSL